MKTDRATRADRGLDLLQQNRDRAKPPEKKLWPTDAGWVPLPELQRELVAQHGARLKELRERGYSIENCMLVRASDGARLSWYRLTPHVPTSLFGDLSPDRTYAE